MSIYSRALALIVMMSTLIIISFSGCATSEKNRAEKPTVREVALKNYVSLDLAYPYYKMALDKLEVRLGKELKTRGEAHITLITPPEFKILTTKLTAERIHAASEEFIKQQPKFTNECIGHFEKKLETGLQHTYFIVVKSDQLVLLRRQLAVEAGLSKAQFDPDLFYPHVTLGFTERDMHFEDGAIKSAMACPDNLKSILRER